MPQQCRNGRTIEVDNVLYYYTSFTVLNGETEGTTIKFQNSVTDEIFKWYDNKLKPSIPINFKLEFIRNIIINHYKESEC